MNTQALPTEAQILDKLVAAIRAAGKKCELVEREINFYGEPKIVKDLMVDDVRVEYSFRERTEGGGYKPRRLGIYTLRVGSYHGYGRVDTLKPVSAPPRKDGSHDYVKLALHACEDAHRQKLDDLQAERRKANSGDVNAIMNELNLTSYSRPMFVGPSENLDAPIRVTVEFTRSLRVNEVRELHALLKKLEVIF